MVTEAQASLLFEHPDECPELVGVLPFLIHPPSRFAASSVWVRFRELTVLPMLAHRPDDPNLPRFLAQIDQVLSWRASVAPELRFWKPDPC
jgi:hypothetical protein